MKTLRGIGDVVRAGSLGTVTESDPTLLNGFDCYVELDVLVATDPAFPGRCFMFSDLEEL